MSDLVYLDASALVKLVLPEAESRALLESFSEREEHVTSELSLVEVVRAARRAAKEQAALERAMQVMASVHLLRIDEAILQRAASLEPRTLRSLDTIHLSSALSLGSALKTMIVYDASLSAAALEAGINVSAPR